MNRLVETVRKERKLLKKLIHQSKEYSNGEIPARDLIIKPNNYYFRQLMGKGLITVAKYNDEDALDAIPSSYCITTQGMHYFEHRGENTHQLMLRSVWLPLLVALLTSLITNGAIYIFQWLLKTL